MNQDPTVLLTLLNQDKVLSISPHSKVIPKDVITTLISCQELLDRLKTQEKEYRKTIIEECEKEKEAASVEGFKEGFKLFSEKLSILEEEVDRVKEVLSKEMLPIALKAAKKVIGDHLQIGDQVFLDSIKKHLKAVKAHKKVTVWVSKEDFPFVEKEKSNLKQNFESLETFSVREKDDLKRGDCLIETDGGIINGRFEHVWAILEEAFKRILAKQTGG